MTQADLAERLVEQGFAFRQQTIVKIEKGQRPLRMREARAIAEALDVNLDDLDAEELVIDRAALLLRHIHSIGASLTALREAVNDLEDYKSHARFALEQAASRGVSQHLLNDGASMLQFDALKVVESELAARRARSAVQAAEWGGTVAAIPYTPPPQGGGDDGGDDVQH